MCLEANGNCLHLASRRSRGLSCQEEVWNQLETQSLSCLPIDLETQGGRSKHVSGPWKKDFNGEGSMFRFGSLREKCSCLRISRMAWARADLEALEDPTTEWSVVSYAD